MNKVSKNKNKKEQGKETVAKKKDGDARTYLLGDHLLDLLVRLALVLELGHHDGELLARLLDDQRLRDLDLRHLQDGVFQSPAQQRERGGNIETSSA